jgi:hypothetical protein
MNAHNQAFQNSLRCLQQPLSLVSIAVLLLNDHVFKIISLSWLTGKLSDFAGLFFFPFLVAAGFSLLLVKFNPKSDTIGRLAFASVFLWFALFKTLPPVNQATNVFLSALVRHPVQLVLDWSDTLALVILWPAWRLWKPSVQTKNRRTGYAPLILGVVACMATSPVPPMVEVVTHLIVKNENLFAFDSINSTIAVSEDGGQTWQWVDEYDSGSLPDKLRPLPITTCAPDNQEECYRVSGQKIVEESHDGGQSWKTSWQLPADRLSYLQRVDSYIDLGPYDLLVIERESHFYVLVAAGEEGVLRKELPNGEWDRIGVQNARPTPYQSGDFFSVIPIIWSELLIWFFASTITFILAGRIVWLSNSRTSKQHLSRMDWIVFPALSTILGIFLTLLVQVVVGVIFYTISLVIRSVFTFPGNIADVILVIALIACLGMGLVVLPFTIYNRLNRWKSILVQHDYPPTIAQSIVSTSFLSHVVVFVMGALIWFCWTLDIISNYNVAFISASIITILSSIFFLKRIENLAGKNNATADK